MDKTIIIEYCESGDPVSDFACSNWIYNVMHTTVDYTVYKVSTSLPVDWVRLMIVKGELDCNKVLFRYFDRTFQANEYGAIVDWPLGFCDISNGLAEDILRTALKRKKNNRKLEN